MKIKLILKINMGENVGIKDGRDGKGKSENKGFRPLDIFSLIIFS